MKKRMIITSALVGILAIASVPFLYAGPGQRGMGAHGGKGGMRGHGSMGLVGHLAQMKEELGLSDQQVEQIRTVFKELREKNAPYRQEMKGGFHDVAETLLANPNDVAAAQALIDQRAAAHKAMQANLLTATSKALSVLSAEQRAKLSGIIEERAASRERRRG